MEHIKNAVQARNLEQTIKIHGALSYDETRKFYAKADAVIIPSVWIESFCLVGLEAMANMKPVIGSKIGGIKDWLLDGKTGYHFEAGNATELAQKIDCLLTDKDSAAKMGINGYERVKQYYNKKIYINSLTNIYRKAGEKFRR